MAEAGGVATDQPGPALLSGWGRTAPTAARLARVASLDDLTAALAQHDRSRGVLARGLGRSYGDAAQNAGGVVLDMTAMQGLLELDDVAGTVTCLGGTSVGQLVDALLPRGWFVPVTPGTRDVTVGGAIASDVHGKNHHRVGSLARHLASIDLLTADGQVRTVSPASSPDLFWATTGGMGLTGVVVRATIRLLRVASSWMAVETTRARDLDDTLDLLDDADRRLPYTVAWIDCLARGRRTGRGVLTSARHAEVDQLPPRHRGRPLQQAGNRLGSIVSVPSGVPSGLLRRETVAVFNEAWFRKAPAHEVDRPQRLRSFFYPLDALRDWNRLYGSGGLVQYQLALPFGAEDVLRKVVASLSRSRAAGLLAVLKRFGEATPAPLSFPMPGWTLAVDLPASAPGIGPLLDGFDEQVAAAGGRVYLSKDGRLRPELLEAMYPGVGEWRDVRRRADPDGVFRSDLARRLSL